MRIISILITLCAFMLFAKTTFAEDNRYIIFETKSGKQISIEDMARISSKSDVVYFGEFHDDSLIHVLQHKFVELFHKLNSNTVISLEMFERDVQSYLNSYLTGEINEEEFLKNSRPWPDYKKFYRQFIEYAKENKLPVIAANIPRKYAAMYATGGYTALKALPGNEQEHIAKQMMLSEDEYLRNFLLTMLGSEEKINALTPNQENTLYLYYGAQSIKDETMAESIVDFLAANRKHKIIHINGDFHSKRFLGTTQKMLNRNKKIKTTVISPLYYSNISEAIFDKAFKQDADFIIFVPEIEREPQSMRGGAHFGENFVEKHTISLEIIPESSKLIGIDRVVFKNPIVKSASLKLLNTLKVESVEVENNKFEFSIRKSDDFYNEIIIYNSSLKTQSYKSGGVVEFNEVIVKYTGTVNFPPSETNLVKRHSNTPGIISNKDGEGIYLPGGSFYPQSDKDLAVFGLEITIPKDFSIVTSGAASRAENGDKAVYSVKTSPLDDLTIVGGRYISKKKIHDGVEFGIYMLKENPNAEKYLDESIKYYDMYVPLFGKYPYESFNIVENFFATGFGMPGYTLLSNRLTAMPWVLLSPGSLAHEFAHNWWGNSVFIDYNYGNWCEALTTFSTNYYYNVLSDNSEEARKWRQKALISIDALPAEKNYPVNDFKYQKDTYDAVIGYDKGAFVFNEIYKLVGKDIFFESLKAFAEKNKGRRAFWMTLIGEFANQSKDKLPNINIRNVFNELIKSTDVPSISIQNAVIEGDSIFVTISSSIKRTMSVPLTIYYVDNSSEKRFFVLSDTLTNFAIHLTQKPDRIELDKDFDVLRKLNNFEKPFNFNRTLNEKPIVILPSKSSKDYALAEKYLELLKESGYDLESFAADEAKEDVLKNNSLLMLGNPANNSVIAKAANILPKELIFQNDILQYNSNKANLSEHIAMINSEHPYSSDKLSTMIVFSGIEDIAQLNRFIHYRSYSLVLLNLNRSGRPIYTQEIYPSYSGKSPLTWKF